MINSLLEPGMMVRNPACPEWGLGQVQSNAGGKITVNFQHTGKVVIDAEVVQLEIDYSSEPVQPRVKRSVKLVNLCVCNPAECLPSCVPLPITPGNSAKFGT